MALIGVTSAHGSPGATSLAVALAHRLPLCTGRAGLLLEADPDGGTIAARHELSGQPGLTALAGAARSGIAAAEVLRYATPLASGLATIASHPAAEQSTAALRTSATNLASALPGLVDHDIVIDLGRLRPGSPAQALAAACDVLLLVCRPVVEQLVAIADRLGNFGKLAPVHLVLIGARPYPPSEVRRVLHVEAMSVVADDRRSVIADPASLRGGRRNGWRTTVGQLAHDIAGSLSRTEPTSSVDVPADQGDLQPVGGE